VPNGKKLTSNSMNGGIQYYNLFENSIDAIYITNPEGSFIDANPAFLNLFGYNKDELNDLYAQKLYEIPDNRANLIAEIDKNGFVKDCKLRFRKKGSSLFDGTISASRLLSESGDFIGYQGIVRDISVQVQTEKSLQIQAELAMSLSSVSHIHNACEILMNVFMRLDTFNGGGVYIHRDSWDYFLCHSCNYNELFTDDKVISNSKVNEFINHERATFVDLIENPDGYGDFISHDIRSLIVLPIRSGSNNLGIIILFSEKETEQVQFFRLFLELTVSQAASAFQRILSEENSRINNKVIQDIMNAMEAGMFIYQLLNGNELNLINYNPAASRILESFSNTSLGIEYDDIWSGAENVKKLKNELLNVIQTSTKTEFHEVEINVGSDKKTYHVKAYTLPGDRIAVTMQDISSRKKTEEALIKNERKYRQMFETSPEAITLIDNRGIIIEVNNRIRDFLSYEPEEILGKPFYELPFLTQSGKELALNNFRKRFQGEAILPYELEFLTKSGKFKIGLVLSSPILDDYGKVIYNLVMIADVSEIKYKNKALETSEVKYRQLLENAQDGIAIVANGKIRLTNQRFTQILGYSFNEVFNYQFDKLFNNDEKANIDNFLNQINSSGDYSSIYKGSILSKDGNTKWIRMNSAPILWDNVYGSMIFIRDISRQKETEEELETVQTLLHQSIQQLPVGIIIVNSKDEKIRLINQHVYDLFGRSEDNPVYRTDLEANNGWKIYDEKDRSIDFEKMPISLAIKGEVTKNLIAKVKTKNNEARTLIINASPIYDKNHELIAGVSLFQDITEERQIREELQAAHEKFKAFIQSLDDMVYFQGLDGKLTMLNPVIEKITGYSIQDFEVNQEAWRNFIHPDDLLEAEKFFSEHPDGIDFHEANYRLKSKSGEWKWIESRMVASRDINGNIIGYNCVDRDITAFQAASDEIQKLNIELESRVNERTSQLESILENLQNEILERRKAETELKSAKEEISKAYMKEKALGELKTRFISMISHEYRTPLTVILTSTYLLEQFFSIANKIQFDKHLDKIRLSVQSMTKLLEDVLMIGRSDAGKVEVFPVTIDLVSLCYELIEEAKLVENHSHQFKLIHNQDYCFIRSDEKLLRQALSNLISNAIKYSDEKTTVTIEIDDKLNEVIVKVSDEGIGIVADDFNHIFEPFHRGQNVGSISGTGLGLSIVKRSIDLIKGSIHWSSNNGNGTQFTISIPKS
jgi:PAS domain S-box-containing protein